MNWIYFKDKLPELYQEILVYKSKMMGGYPEGVYKATYEKYRDQSTNIVEDVIVLYEPSCTNGNNIRFMKEFSAWMNLPTKP